MILVSQLSKSFGGGRSLFANASFVLNAGSRYGLVGANGSGKTTFLKIIAGDEPATSGSVVMPTGARVGILRQDRFMDDAQLTLHVAMQGDARTWAAIQERDRIAAGDGDPLRLADLEHEIATLGGATLEARTAAILEGLGIPQKAHRQPLGTISGGFKLRVLLAQVLVGGPDAVFLDEPTNHLDILSIRWLEKFLAAYRGAALVISHDQRFLDNVATHILDVDYDTITPYVGNYAAFVTQKADIRARKEQAIARTQEEIAHKREFVERFGAKNTKATQAQSRVKQIEKLEAGLEDLADSSRRTPTFRFEPRRPSGRDVLEFSGVDKAYGEKRVLSGVSLLVRRGEKVAVIGPNGLGKSTLLKIAMGQVAADAGTARFGHEVHVGYFAQDHRDLLTDGAQTPLDFIWSVIPSEPTAYVRGQLGRVLFSGADVEKPIGSLSGGEAARLIFGRLAVERPNTLLLDEPTNHLDLEAIGALADGLRSFDGTVIFVSHDRWFVSQLATRIVEVTPTGLRDFAGTYAEYLARRGDDHLDVDLVAARAQQAARSQAATPAAPSQNQLSWEEQKKRKNRLAGLPARRDKLLAAIAEAEDRRRAIVTRLEDPALHTREQATALAALMAEDAQLAAQIDTQLAEWEAIETELAEQPS